MKGKPWKHTFLKTSAAAGHTVAADMTSIARTIALTLKRGEASDGRYNLTRTIRAANVLVDAAGLEFGTGQLQRHDWSMVGTIFSHLNFLRMIKQTTDLRTRGLVIHQIQVKDPGEDTFQVIGTIAEDDSSRLVGYCIHGVNPRGERNIMLACLSRLCTSESLRYYESKR